MINRKKWFIIFLLNIVTLGLYTFVVGKKLKVYKDEWYKKWYLWVAGFLFGIFPAIVMFIIFYIKIGCEVSKKLNVPYANIYAYPYIWIVFFIIPIVGWTFFILLNIYVHTWYVIYIKRGYGESI